MADAIAIWDRVYQICAVVIGILFNFAIAHINAKFKELSADQDTSSEAVHAVDKRVAVLESQVSHLQAQLSQISFRKT